MHSKLVLVAWTFPGARRVASSWCLSETAPPLGNRKRTDTHLAQKLSFLLSLHCHSDLGTKQSKATASTGTVCRARCGGATRNATTGINECARSMGETEIIHSCKLFTGKSLSPRVSASHLLLLLWEKKSSFLLQVSNEFRNSGIITENQKLPQCGSGTE